MKRLHWLAVGILATALAACGGTPIPSKPTVAAVATTSNLNGTTANAKKNDIRNQAKGIPTLMGFGRLFKSGAPLSQVFAKLLPQLNQDQQLALQRVLVRQSGLSLQASGPCSSGSVSTPISSNADTDADGIPAEVLVTFNNCVFSSGSSSATLNGAIYIKDGNNNDPKSSYTIIIDLTIASTGEQLRLQLGVDYTAPAVATGAHKFDFVIRLTQTKAGVTSDVGVAFSSSFQPSGGGTDPYGNGVLNFTGNYSENSGGTSYGFNLTGTNLGVSTTCDDFNAGSLRVADTDSFFQINYTGCGTGNYTGDITGTF